MSTDYNISLTNSALKKIHSLAGEEQTQDSVLRIAVSGGGCSGFKYNFLMDQAPSLNDEDDNDDDDFENEDDDDDFDEEEADFSKKNIVIRDNRGKPILMVDDCSAKFLSGAVIDYIEDLSGSGFHIKNEMAKSQCGCGNSFSI